MICRTHDLYVVPNPLLCTIQVGQIFLTFEGTSQNPGGTENFTNIGFSNITGGTGIYENISGYGLNKGEFNPETGYSSFEFTLKYTK